MPAITNERPVVLVTGGTGGIGRHVCATLSEAGYNVAFTYNSNIQKAEVLTAKLQENGAEVLSEAVQLTDPEQVDGVFANTIERFGRIDAVVYAAGPYPDQRFVSSFTSEQFRLHVDQELNAFFEVVRCALPHLRESKGAITAVTSVAVRHFPAKDGLSSIPKGGMEALVRAIAKEEGKFGVRANATAPGVLDDGMMDMLDSTGDVTDEMRASLKRTIPLRRLGNGADVAGAVAFLLSPKASYITGQTIDIDGGYSL